MRTTVDLPDDIHALARQLAHDSNRSMSDVVTELIRLGLHESRSPKGSSSHGLPQISIGRAITSDDVRSLDDEE